MIDFILLFSLFIFAISSFALLSAPLETLHWWIHLPNDSQELSLKAPTILDNTKQILGNRTMCEDSNFVVFLDGIAKADSSNYSYIEHFLEHLGNSLPNCKIITDQMPYSVIDNDLTHGRPLSPLWRHAFQRKIAKPTDSIGFLINFRNMLQVLVSADYRYGPIYNLGEAQQIVNQLLASGYQLDSKKPLTLIGFSGGAQVALGAATYLKKALNVPIHIIAIGGTYCVDPSLKDVEHFYNLRGTKDMVYRFTRFFFPRRWLLPQRTNWGRFVSEGRFTDVVVGPVSHVGENSYMDAHNNVGPTVGVISSIIKTYTIE